MMDRQRHVKGAGQWLDEQKAAAVRAANSAAALAPTTTVGATLHVPVRKRASQPHKASNPPKKRAHVASKPPATSIQRVSALLHQALQAGSRLPVATTDHSLADVRPPPTDSEASMPPPRHAQPVQLPPPPSAVPNTTTLPPDVSISANADSAALPPKPKKRLKIKYAPVPKVTGSEMASDTPMWPTNANPSLYQHYQELTRQAADGSGNVSHHTTSPGAPAGADGCTMPHSAPLPPAPSAPPCAAHPAAASAAQCAAVPCAAILQVAPIAEQGGDAELSGGLPTGDVATATAHTGASAPAEPAPAAQLLVPIRPVPAAQSTLDGMTASEPSAGVPIKDVSADETALRPWQRAEVPHNDAPASAAADAGNAACTPDAAAAAVQEQPLQAAPIPPAAGFADLIPAAPVAMQAAAPVGEMLMSSPPATPTSSPVASSPDSSPVACGTLPVRASGREVLLSSPPATPDSPTAVPEVAAPSATISPCGGSLLGVASPAPTAAASLSPPQACLPVACSPFAPPSDSAPGPSGAPGADAGPGPAREGAVAARRSSHTPEHASAEPCWPGGAALEAEAGGAAGPAAPPPAAAAAALESGVELATRDGRRTGRTSASAGAASSEDAEGRVEAAGAAVGGSCGGERENPEADPAACDRRVSDEVAQPDVAGGGLEGHVVMSSDVGTGAAAATGTVAAMDAAVSADGTAGRDALPADPVKASTACAAADAAHPITEMGPAVAAAAPGAADLDGGGAPDEAAATESIAASAAAVSLTAGDATASGGTDEWRGHDGHASRQTGSVEGSRADDDVGGDDNIPGHHASTPEAEHVPCAGAQQPAETGGPVPRAASRAGTAPPAGPADTCADCGAVDPGAEAAPAVVVLPEAQGGVSAEAGAADGTAGGTTDGISESSAQQSPSTRTASSPDDLATATEDAAVVAGSAPAEPAAAVAVQAAAPAAEAVAEMALVVGAAAGAAEAHSSGCEAPEQDRPVAMAAGTETCLPQEHAAQPFAPVHAAAVPAQLCTAVPEQGGACIASTAAERDHPAAPDGGAGASAVHGVDRRGAGALGVPGGGSEGAAEAAAARQISENEMADGVGTPPAQTVAGRPRRAEASGGARMEDSKRRSGGGGARVARAAKRRRLVAAPMAAPTAEAATAPHATDDAAVPAEASALARSAVADKGEPQSAPEEDSRCGTDDRALAQNAEGTGEAGADAVAARTLPAAGQVEERAPAAAQRAHARAARDAAAAEHTAQPNSCVAGKDAKGGAVADHTSGTAHSVAPAAPSTQASVEMPADTGEPFGAGLRAQEPSATGGSHVGAAGVPTAEATSTVRGAAGGAGCLVEPRAAVSEAAEPEPGPTAESCKGAEAILQAAADAEVDAGVPSCVCGPCSAGGQTCVCT
eukprot:jgi/Ulvmu1/10899/UM007_0076.1